MMQCTGFTLRAVSMYIEPLVKHVVGVVSLLDGAQLRETISVYHSKRLIPVAEVDITRIDC